MPFIFSVENLFTILGNFGPCVTICYPHYVFHIMDCSHLVYSESFPQLETHEFQFCIFNEESKDVYRTRKTMTNVVSCLVLNVQKGVGESKHTYSLQLALQVSELHNCIMYQWHFDITKGQGTGKICSMELRMY